MTVEDPNFLIEFAPVVSDADVERIMAGDDAELKAFVWNLIMHRTSRSKRALDKIFKSMEANTLEGAKPDTSGNKHRGGGRSVNKGAGLRAFFRRPSQSRRRHGR